MKGASFFEQISLAFLQILRFSALALQMSMNSFLQRLMYENTCELKRLIKEGLDAAAQKQYKILKLKMTALEHAMQVGKRLMQIQALWNSSARVA